MLSPLPQRSLLVLLVAWLPAGAAGWVIHKSLDAGGQDDVQHAGLWLGCAGLAVGIGALTARAFPASTREDRVVRLAVLVAVGWAVATAAGWSFAVQVGGPASGLVTGLGLAAARTGTGIRIAPVALVAGSGVVGLIAGWLLVGDRVPVVGLFVPMACGLVAVTAAHRVIAPELRLLPVLGSTCAWGAAFVGAWLLTSTTIAPISYALSIGVEFVLAAALGAVALGWATRASTGEPVHHVVVRWTASSAIGVIGGVAVALVLRDLGDDTAVGLMARADVGTSLGLGVAAGFAVLPTLRRMLRAADVSHAPTA